MSSPSQPPIPTRVLDESGIFCSTATFPHAAITIDGFLAQPQAAGVYPAVLVIAGNRITEEYIPNTCAALALAGFVGFAPNIYHVLPDTALTLAEIRQALANRVDEDVVSEILSVAAYLKGLPYVDAKRLGILGFCYGGRLALLVGARSPDMRAVLTFHPGAVTDDEITGLRAPVQIQHGTADRSVALDESVNLERRLRAQQTPVELHTYAEADHGFLAYTRPTYKPDAAQLAWRRAIEFLTSRLT